MIIRHNRMLEIFANAKNRNPESSFVSIHYTKLFSNIKARVTNQKYLSESLGLSMMPANLVITHLLLLGGHELVGAADVVLAQLHQQRGQEPGLAVSGRQHVAV